MNFSFGFVLEKVTFCMLCGRPVTHWSPKLDPTRPATGRLDRFPSLYRIFYGVCSQKIWKTALATVQYHWSLDVVATGECCRSGWSVHAVVKV